MCVVSNSLLIIHFHKRNRWWKGEEETIERISWDGDSPFCTTKSSSSCNISLHRMEGGWQMIVAKRGGGGKRREKERREPASSSSPISYRTSRPFLALRGRGGGGGDQLRGGFGAAAAALLLWLLLLPATNAGSVLLTTHFFLQKQEREEGRGKESVAPRGGTIPIFSVPVRFGSKFFGAGSVRF